MPLQHWDNAHTMRDGRAWHCEHDKYGEAGTGAVRRVAPPLASGGRAHAGAAGGTRRPQPCRHHGVGVRQAAHPPVHHGRTTRRRAGARCAAPAGARRGARFPAGVTLVALPPVRDPDLVPGAIARALGLLDVGGRPAIERLSELLAERRQLVVLDNLEQVLPAAALYIAALLVACPRLALLATSRVPLRLRWEQTLRVAPLPVPDSTAPLPPLDTLVAIPSVALFVGRA